MLSRIFNHTDLMTKSLDSSWLKMEVNSQNISNADTPGYDAKRVEFDTEFARALGTYDTFKNRTTRSGHIEFYNSDPLSVKATVVADTNSVMRMDDNNVDIDKEMVEMAKNTIQYNAMIQKVNSELTRLKTAISGT